MAIMMIGDIHGCYKEFMLLLEKAQFNEREDSLWLTGDLVGRGKDSLSVLREVFKLKDSIRLVLGNHDLHLIAVDAGITEAKPKDKLDKILNAKEKDELLFWLRNQPLLQLDEENKLIMTHAGISPQWDLSTLKSNASEIHEVLSKPNYVNFLTHMYGDTPNSWHDKLSGFARLRFITNALTRMRFCFANGELDFLCKSAPNEAPVPLKPWFELPLQIGTDFTIAFGHWAALAGKLDSEHILALDTGCVWGGALTLYNFHNKEYIRQSLL